MPSMSWQSRQHPCSTVLAWKAGGLSSSQRDVKDDIGEVGDAKILQEAGKGVPRIEHQVHFAQLISVLD